jgi:hypothetical protein
MSRSCESTLCAPHSDVEPQIGRSDKALVDATVSAEFTFTAHFEHNSQGVRSYISSTQVMLHG